MHALQAKRERVGKRIARAKYCTTHKQNRGSRRKNHPCKILHDLHLGQGETTGPDLQKFINRLTFFLVHIARSTSGAGERQQKNRSCKILHALRAERREPAYNCRAKYCTHCERSGRETAKESLVQNIARLKRSRERTAKQPPCKTWYASERKSI